MKQRIIIIGGGFFGLYLADYLAQKKHEVILFEKDIDFMTRASFNNQARVHNGYHYPRSILTALRSRASFPRFCKEFPDSIDDSFKKYYLIGKIMSKVTAHQYRQFCNRIGAPCEPVKDEFVELINTNLIEQVFLTEEVAFDVMKLKEIMVERVRSSGVRLYVNTRVDALKEIDGSLEVTINHNDGVTREKADHIFNCTYSMLNYLFRDKVNEIIPLKHEMTEMCLVGVPDELKKIGITVMCGPFFSIMPFPASNLHSFSHVRYTPHYEWYDGENAEYFNAHEHLDSTRIESNWNKMQYDAKRYIPLLQECEYKRSIFEVKTILPRSEEDDSRPILFKPNYNGINGFHCILGGKIDNIYDVIDSIENLELI